MDTLSPRSWNRTFKQEVKLWYLTFSTEPSEHCASIVHQVSEKQPLIQLLKNQEKTKYPSKLKSQTKKRRGRQELINHLYRYAIYIYLWVGVGRKYWVIDGYWEGLREREGEREGRERKLSICKRKKTTLSILSSSSLSLIIGWLIH